MPRDARELVRDSIDGDYVLDALRPEGASAVVLVWDGDGTVTVRPVERVHPSVVLRNREMAWREHPPPRDADGP
jgi:hypothetical protein